MDYVHVGNAMNEYKLYCMLFVLSSSFIFWHLWFDLMSIGVDASTMSDPLQLEAKALLESGWWSGQNVKLHAYCIHKRCMFLIYEYMERGSLFWVLSNDTEAMELNWNKRLIKCHSQSCTCFVLYTS